MPAAFGEDVSGAINWGKAPLWRLGARALNVPVMPNRWRDWMRQAERDLEQAGDSARAGWHEWACFAAHQSAEKSVKALHLQHAQEARGYVVARLLSELPGPLSVPDELVERGRALDNLYIATGYPNGHPSGAPFEHYGSMQSRQAIEYAGEIIEFVRLQLA